jgi:ferric-dicitrate binding protein FerR (iron transport regulator)
LKENNSYLKFFEKYLSGNCTDDEKLYVENLLIHSPEIHDLFNEYRQIWNFSGQKVLNTSIDVEANWIELNKRICTLDAISLDLEVDRFSVSKQFIFTLSKVAAVIIIALGVFFIFNYLKTDQPAVIKSFTVSEVQSTPFILADGSEVYMNKGAEITYPEKFGTESREIGFMGSAFFNIAHNSEKPFIITTGGLQVEVLGTSFNLCTCPESDETELCLEEGKVRFSSINVADGSVRNQIILTPGQKGIFNRNTGVISMEEIKNKNYLAWKTGILVFDKTALDEVFSTIEQTYNIKVVTYKPYNSFSLTARFEKETPESIFESLHTIFGIQYSFNGKCVTLN